MTKKELNYLKNHIRKQYRSGMCNSNFMTEEDAVNTILYFFGESFLKDLQFIPETGSIDNSEDRLMKDIIDNGFVPDSTEVSKKICNLRNT